MVNAILYRLAFNNGKVYIGITREGLTRRVSRHIAYARAGKNLALSAAIRKHGETSFVAEQLLIGPLDEMLSAEIAAIADHKARGIGCYNMTAGGEGSLGLPPSAAKREAISKSLRGRTLTEAHRMRVSQAQRGKIIPPETRQKMRDAARKRVADPMPVAQREAISRSLAGKKRPPELMARIWETRKKNATASLHACDQKK